MFWTFKNKTSISVYSMFFHLWRVFLFLLAVISASLHWWLSSNGVLTVWMYRQRLELKSIQAGLGLIAAKQVASVIKTLDPNYVAMSLEAEPVKSECKKCPSVSKHRFIGHQVAQLSRTSVKGSFCPSRTRTGPTYQSKMHPGVGSMEVLQWCSPHENVLRSTTKSTNLFALFQRLSAVFLQITGKYNTLLFCVTFANLEVAEAYFLWVKGWKINFKVVDWCSQTVLPWRSWTVPRN